MPKFTFGAILICALAALCTATCPAQVIEKSVTNADINNIVNKHNQLRSLIAQGKVPGQPRGTNVKNLQWDAALARKAQEIANTCTFRHVPVADPRWSYIGQNLGSESFSPKGADWNYIIQLWFDEHKNFKYPRTSLGVTGHYTQVVYADTTHVGCGYTSYVRNGEHKKFYVCNYGPGDNGRGAPYKTT